MTKRKLHKKRKLKEINSERKTKVSTKNKHGIRKSAENRKEQATDDPGAENLKQELTAIG